MMLQMTTASRRLVQTCPKAITTCMAAMTCSRSIHHSANCLCCASNSLPHINASRTPVKARQFHSTITPYEQAQAKQSETLDEYVKLDEMAQIVHQYYKKGAHPHQEGAPVIIDVRSEAEARGGMIPGAHNVPVNSILASLPMNPGDFQVKYHFRKPEKEDQVIFYCLSGTRCEFALRIAKSLGYTKARSYKGSWSEWAKHGEKALTALSENTPKK